MKNEIKFKEYMSGLGELFDKKLSDTLKDIYWKALLPYPDKECEIAFDQLIRTCKFFPKPSEFIEIMKGPESDRVLLAWSKVMSALSESTVVHHDKAIEDTIKALGGWEYIGTQTYDELKWVEKRFMDFFPVMEKRYPVKTFNFYLKNEEIKQLTDVKIEI